MAGQRRRRLSSQAWREVLKRFGSSGKTVGEFCEREGVAVSSFHRWRGRLMDKATDETAAQTLPVKHRSVLRQAAGQRPATPFVDLGSLGGVGSAEARMHEGALDLRLELGGGLSLHLVRR